MLTRPPVGRFGLEIDGVAAVRQLDDAPAVTHIDAWELPRAGEQQRFEDQLARAKLRLRRRPARPGRARFLQGIRAATATAPDAVRDRANACSTRRRLRALLKGCRRAVRRRCRDGDRFPSTARRAYWPWDGSTSRACRPARGRAHHVNQALQQARDRRVLRPRLPRRCAQAPSEDLRRKFLPPLI